MAVYNTSSDSANTAIRAFLTKVGEHYWGKSFNTGSGKSKKIFDRKKKIQNHMSKGEFKYPELNEAEQHAIRVIASSLYDNIKTENDKALKMYQELDQAFVKK